MRPSPHKKAVTPARPGISLSLSVGQKRTHAETWWKGAPAWNQQTLTSTLSTRTQNAEVLTLTYGALVRQLVADLDDVDAVNKQLDQM